MGKMPGWGIYSTYIPQFILIWCCKNEGGLWRYMLQEVCYSNSQTAILLPKADMVYMEVEVCLFQLISNDRGIKLTISSSITWYSHANLLTWNLYVLIPTYFLGFVPEFLNQHLSGYWYYGYWCALTEQYQTKSSYLGSHRTHHKVQFTRWKHSAKSDILLDISHSHQLVPQYLNTF